MDHGYQRPPVRMATTRADPTRTGSFRVECGRLDVDRCRPCQRTSTASPGGRRGLRSRRPGVRGSGPPSRLARFRAVAWCCARPTSNTPGTLRIARISAGRCGGVRELERVGVAYPLLAGRFDGRRDDVDALQGDGLGEVGEQMGPSEGLDEERDAALRGVPPAHADLRAPAGPSCAPPPAHSTRCTVTAPPRTAKPVISSGGTGVQQPARRTVAPGWSTTTSAAAGTCGGLRPRTGGGSSAGASARLSAG